MAEPLLVASFPLPLSINEMYATDRNGKRRLTYEAITYKALVKSFLDAPRTVAPPSRIYQLNVSAIQDLRIDFRVKSSSKSAIAAKERHRLSIEILYCFTNDRSDVDARIKCLQDTICEWLACDGEIKFDDHFVARVVAEKCVAPYLKEPYCEVEVREIEVAWTPGKIIHRFQQEQALREAQNTWGKTEKMDFSVQTTARTEAS